MIQSSPGSALPLSDSTIAYVPHHYAGKISLFQKAPQAG